jgi:squalene-associated FAD-dependent desaturase
MGVQLKPSVAIIGGGCAGLAAATELASRGLAVTLFESSRQLGGRARGLNWKGRRLDNGQHILLGAYEETLRLLSMAGVNEEQALLRLPLQLVQHQQFELHASRFLPAPLHLLSGLIKSHGLTLNERLAALRMMASLKLSKFSLPQDEPLEVFLTRQRQPASLIRWLWEPLCLAALNTPVREASAQIFLNVLRDSFSRTRHHSDLLLPKTDLSSLLAESLATYVQSYGTTIHLNSAVTAIAQQPDGFEVSHNGEASTFSHLIVSTSPWQAKLLLQALPDLAPVTDQISAFAYQPIYTVYLQYPDAIALPSPIIGLCGGHSQWVIDRGTLDGQTGLVSVVISAEGPHQSLTQDALAQAVTAELQQAFALDKLPLWHKVIAEKRATFSCRPNLPRPEQQLPVSRLYLAGDYTHGDYPATIEGAVRSGVKCARLLLNQL